MQKITIGLVACALAACTGAHKKETKIATAIPTSVPAQKPPEEVGLLDVKLAPLSEQVACVYGGWTCLSGEQFPLLRCTTDAGLTYQEVPVASQCSFLQDYQVSRDGNSVWFSCESKGAPHFLRSNDQAKTFSLSDPINPSGDLLAWNFSSSKNGIAVIAAEGDLSQQDAAAYIEKSTKDAGATWQPLLEIKGEFAAQFNPEQEVGRRPPQPSSSLFVLQRTQGPDGGPAYQMSDINGKPTLSLAWRDIPGKCSPATAAPIEELLPGFGNIGQPLPK